MITTVRGRTQEVRISRELPAVVIGERINPSGRKRMAEMLRSGDLRMLSQEAVAQEAEGARIIDVNVGTAGVDQVALLPEAVRAVASATGLPLCIDSSDPDAIAAALAVYEGKALVNSVTGDEVSLSTVLPVVKRYKAAVIGLCQDESGIPRDPRERLGIARRILESAKSFGIDESDLVIDPAVLTVGVDGEAANITLATAQLIADNLGLNMTLGASNVSFGLPNRHFINNTFLSSALRVGVTAPIANPSAPGLMETILAADLLRGRDDFATNYLRYYRKKMSLAGRK